MKKKHVIIIISIILIISLITIQINNNSNTFMSDGTLVALTVDGEKRTSFPDSGSYTISISCINGIGMWLPDEGKLIVNDITGNVKCDIDFKTKTSSDSLINVITSQTVEHGSIGVVNEGTVGYRYEGKNPNNYIWFNNELWRILGVIPTKTDSGTKNLVKIIRSDSIGGIAYDAKSNGFTGAWGSNTLYTLLNNYYYGKVDATDTDYCYGYSTTARSKCDYSFFGVEPSSYYGSMVKNVYWNTGASLGTITASEAYNNEIKNQTVIGYVGLMSSSDYAYATSESHSETLEQYNSRIYTTGNWLYGNGYEWLITQNSATTEKALNIRYDGYIANYNANHGSSIRPVVYLSDTIYRVSGDGTITYPYIIGK